MSAINGLRRGACVGAVLAGLAALAVAGCGSGKSSSSVKTGGKLLPPSSDWPAPQPAVAPRTGSGTPIKVGVLSDCQGAFGSFDNQDLAGVVSAMSQFAGARPKNPNKPRDGWTAGAQDTTLKVQAPNFFRFNGDGAQWNAGLGQIAYNKLGWRKAVVVADDYSFGWTSAAGFIADFCAAGGQVVQRVSPPLNTTDYSSYAQQANANADGTFVAVGGAGLIPFLKAYEQAHGPIDPKKFMGNLFWGTPSLFEQLGPRVSGAYIGSAG